MEALAGAAAGVTGTLLGYPLDALKGRMQVSTRGLVAEARALASSGLGGTYRGVTAPLINLTLLNALSFSTYASTRELVGLPPVESRAAGQAPMWKAALAGAMVRFANAQIHQLC